MASPMAGDQHQYAQGMPGASGKRTQSHAAFHGVSDGKGEVFGRSGSGSLPSLSPSAVSSLTASLAALAGIRSREDRAEEGRSGSPPNRRQTQPRGSRRHSYDGTAASRLRQPGANAAEPGPQGQPRKPLASQQDGQAVPSCGVSGFLIRTPLDDHARQGDLGRASADGCGTAGSSRRQAAGAKQAGMKLMSAVVSSRSHRLIAIP